MKKILCIVLAVLMTAAVFSACGAKAKPLSDIFSGIKSEYKLSDMVEYTDVNSLERTYGITADDVDEVAGGVNNSGVDMEEIVLVKAKNADAAKTVAEKLTNRLNSKLAETKSYNPEQYAIVEKSSVDTDDLYVSLIISKDLDGIKKLYKEGIGVK